MALASDASQPSWSYGSFLMLRQGQAASLKPDLGTAARCAGLLLFLWAWVKTWSELVSHLQDVRVQGISYLHHAERSLPVAVLLTGLLATNILGFLHYKQANRKRMAVASALDLDTLLVVIAQGREVMAGLPCPDWDELQMRQVAWRSIPLAVITFFLAARQMLEVPCCQCAASMSVLGGEYGKSCKEEPVRLVRCP